MHVIVVGGGVLGSMHAWQALAAGHSVLQLERDVEAVSASVRNFGLVWVSGRRDGAELTLAKRARELWEQISEQASGIGFRPHGSLTVARDASELAVMEIYAAGQGAVDRDTRLVDVAEMRRINSAVKGDVAGALYCHSDAIVESRVAQPALRSAMATSGRYQFLNSRNVVTYDTHPSGRVSVTDHIGDTHDADLVIICAGAIHDALAAEHFRTAPLRRCQLQMMQTAPFDQQLTTSIADADSLRYYPAYENLPLHSLAPQPAVAAAARMQLLLVQRLDGGLTIGDTHIYDDDGPFPFDVDEDPYRHLIARAEEILGRQLPPIKRRWSGVYSQLSPAAAAGQIYYRGEVAPGVITVTGPAGRGMTLAPAIAEETWRTL
jgi:FAD dependent oxidoreductase TIGR03364